MKLGLLLRVNVVLIPALALVYGGLYSVYRGAEESQERAQAVHTAKLLIDAASAVRKYTAENVKPMIESKYAFSPLTVSSYAANQTLTHMRSEYPDYHYREVALNPTNPLDRAADWEGDIVRYFRENPTAKEFVGEHASINGANVVIAKPLRVGNPACLDCHSTPERAPKEMVGLYPAGGGYGWQLNEVVGAQIISVPAEYAPGVTAGPSKLPFAYALALALGALWAVINAALVFFLRGRV